MALSQRRKSEDLDCLRPHRIQVCRGTLKTQGGTRKEQQQEADLVLQVTEVADRAPFLAVDFILGEERNQKRARSSWKPG